MQTDGGEMLMKGPLGRAVGRFARTAFRAELASAWTLFLSLGLLASVPTAGIVCLWVGSTVAQAAIGFAVAAGTAATMATLAGASLALRRRRSRGRVARVLDEVTAQPDLISSALEWDGEGDHPMKELTKLQAIEAVSSLRAREVFPARVSEALAPSLGVSSLVVIVVLLVISSPPREVRVEAATVAAQEMPALTASPSAAARGGDVRGTSAGAGERESADLAEQAAALFRQRMAPPRTAPESEREEPDEDSPSSQDPSEEHSDEPSQDSPPDPWDVPEDVGFVPERLSAKVGKGEYLFETVEIETGRKSEDSYPALVLRYEQRALDMIRQDRIPPEHRETVRSYFRKIRP